MSAPRDLAALARDDQGAVAFERSRAETMFARLEEGSRGNPGITRDTYGDGENVGHRIFAEQAGAMNLPVPRDAAANTSATCPAATGTRPARPHGLASRQRAAYRQFRQSGRRGGRSRDGAPRPGLPVAQDEALRQAIEAGFEAVDAGVGTGASRILNAFTVSVGVIQGGVKINVPPGHCRMEVDIRLPVGTRHARLLAEIERIVARHPPATMRPIWTHSAEPTVSDPTHEMMGILKRTVRALGRPEPVASVSRGATDCKHWRNASVPSYVYGCRPTGMPRRTNEARWRNTSTLFARMPLRLRPI